MGDRRVITLILDLETYMVEVGHGMYRLLLFFLNDFIFCT